MSKPFRTTPVTELDYRFAWRWLLPLQLGEATATIGLTPDEQQWWQQRHPLATPPQASTVLLALDNITSGQLDHYLSALSVQHLCAWGKGKMVKRLARRLNDFADVRCYALLPVTMPRVVVPLTSPAAAVAGLRLHQPGRRLARLALGFAAWLVRFSHYRLLEGKMLLIACRDAPCQAAGARQAGFALVNGSTDFALYLGTPEADRKTVALPVPVTQENSIIKAGDNPLACQALRNEAAALTALQHTCLHRRVPAVRRLKDGSTQVALVQEYRPRLACSQHQLGQAAQAFLQALATTDGRQATFGEVLATIPSNPPGAMADLCRCLATLPAQTPLRLHRCHGDFAPWNCAWTDQGLFVYDWEASRPDGLALSDAFYYVLAPLHLLQESADGEQALHAVQAFTAPLAEFLGIGNELPVYLSLWLLQQDDAPALYRNLASALIKCWRETTC